MRLVLVDNPLYQLDPGPRAARPWPPLGLLSLVAVARQEGHDAVVVDPKLELRSGRWTTGSHAYETAARYILAESPDVVGFSTLGCSLPFTVGIANALRRLAPEVGILAGGPHATMLATELMCSYRCFDLVFRGEAENALRSFLGNGVPTAIAGTTTRAGDQVVSHGPPGIIDDLDALPTPAYDAYPVEGSGLTILPVEAGRGCPFRCDFCSSATFFGRRFRLKSAGRLWREMDELAASYTIREFDLVHDMFTANRKKVLAFCKEANGRPYRWNCSARIDCVDQELVEAMAVAGCQSIFFGVEFGSERLQKASQKGLDLRRLREALDLCEKYRIRPTVSFITGHPHETEHDQEQTIDLMEQLLERYGTDGVHVNVQLHELTPEPGTRLWAENRERLAYDGRVWDFNVPPQCDADIEIIRSHPDLFMTYHFYEGALPRNQVTETTNAWHSLRPLGPALIAGLARHCGGLAQLIANLREPHPGGGCQYAHLEDWAAREWGLGHPVTSLVRLHLAVAGLRVSEPPPGTQGAVPWRLAKRLALLENLHEVATLQAAWRSSSDLDGLALDGPLLDQVITIDPRTQQVFAHHIDPSSLRALQDILGGRMPDDPLPLEVLASQGWLTATNATLVHGPLAIR